MARIELSKASILVQKLPDISFEKKTGQWENTRWPVHVTGLVLFFFNCPSSSVAMLLRPQGQSQAGAGSLVLVPR